MAARSRKKKNPAELLIFGNPSRKRAKRNAMPITPGELNDLQALYGRAPASAQSYADKINWAASEFNKKHPGKATQARTALRAKNPSNAFRQRMVKVEAGTVARNLELKHVKKNLAAAKKAKHKGDIKFWSGQLSTLTNPKRRNPSDAHQAVKLFESFHGKDAKEIIEAQRSAAMRLDYTALGPLIALGFDTGGFPDSKLKDKWDECPHIAFEGDGVILSSAPNGRQLYFIEGNQNLDSSLSMFEGVDTEKDLIDLGDVHFVVYEARKIHDNFEPADYCHRFGEGGKTLPRLAYDKLKKEMLLIGGEYFISTKAGISPGIEG